MALKPMKSTGGILYQTIPSLVTMLNCIHCQNPQVSHTEGGFISLELSIVSLWSFMSQVFRKKKFLEAFSTF